MICILMMSASAFAVEDYRVGDESWKMELLLDTCKRKLNTAVKEARESLATRGFLSEGEWVAVLPETVGYRYFNVKFMKVVVGIAVPTDSIEYQFDFETIDDEFQKCDRVEPRLAIY